MANERTDRAARLDQPREARRGLFSRPRVDPDTFGRFAEKFARYMGTAKFLVYMTVFVLLWVTVNVVGIMSHIWDKYPFIFLTLMLSLQASYAAPLILLAQNRQEHRDRTKATSIVTSANARRPTPSSSPARLPASGCYSPTSPRPARLATTSTGWPRRSTG